MSAQPEALRLADELERDKWHVSAVTMQVAADELRRLHEQNERLRIVAEMSTLLLDQRDALLVLLRELAECPSLTDCVDWWLRASRAIKAIEGEKE